MMREDMPNLWLRMAGEGQAKREGVYPAAYTDA